MASTPQLTINKSPGTNLCYDEVLADDVLPLRMLQIPAGNFLMGSPEDELERLDREGPQHEVTLRQFFLAKYPVTQAQWRIVAGWPQVEQELERDPSNFKGDLHPVEQVSWHDAVEFCARLAQHTNRPYRLPTEVEWEYACRAGTTTPFHFGETISTDYANYCGEDRTIGGTDYSGSYGDGPKGEYRQETTPVDHFEGANAWGLCDMHGNVWEWCEDPWHESYKGAPETSRAWLASDDSKYRVRRGGSWLFNPRYCRSASRSSHPPGNRVNALGFRVCCSPPQV